MKKKGVNWSLVFGALMIIVSIVCVIRFFVLLGGGG